MKKRNVKRSKSRTRTKFHNKRTGKYDSEFEAEVAKSLAKARVKVEHEPPSLDYIMYRTYIPDFKITRRDGSEFYVEVKGYFDPDARSKMIAVKKAWPDLDIRILFQKYSKKYDNWCKRYKYRCAFKAIPKEWCYE